MRKKLKKLWAVLHKKQPVVQREPGALKTALEVARERPQATYDPEDIKTPPGTFSSSGWLCESRPQLNFGDIWCLKCNKACEFDETGGHRLWSSKDREGETQGYLYIRAYCHGEHVDIQMTFEQARHRTGRLEVFGDIQIEEPVPRLKEFKDEKLDEVENASINRLHEPDRRAQIQPPQADRSH